MRRGFFLLPNLLTTGNLCCGFLSIVFAMTDAMRLSNLPAFEQAFVYSAWLIMLAMVLDLFDGLVARVTKSTSKFGVEYDSLADMVSFGVAPAILVYLSVLRYHGKIGWVFATAYVIGGALRLARYNVQSGTTENKHFIGLPIPAAAGILSSYVLLSHWGGWYYESKKVFLNVAMGWYEERITFFNQAFIPILTILLAFLMVSTIDYPGFKSYATKEKFPFVVLFLCVIFLLVIVVTPEIAGFSLMMLYLIYGLFTGTFKKGAKKVELIREKRKWRKKL